MISVMVLVEEVHGVVFRFECTQKSAMELLGLVPSTTVACTNADYTMPKLGIIFLVFLLRTDD